MLRLLMDNQAGTVRIGKSIEVKFCIVSVRDSFDIKMIFRIFFWENG